MSQTEPQSERVREKPGPKPTHTHCTVPGCGKPHYARGLCRSHSRQWNSWDDNYEHSDKAARRRKAYYIRRKAIAALTGETSMTKVFSDRQHLATLRQALEAGDETLLRGWAAFNPQQQEAIKTGVTQ
jgi:hypothetical protein